MALVHSFSIVKDKLKQVDVSDDLISYLSDSFFWISSLWNEKELNKGLPYYGEAIIEVAEVCKFREIIMQWKNLFALSSEKLELTGNYLIDEMKYEKISYSKKELLEIFDKLIQLCVTAEAIHSSILYEGI